MLEILIILSTYIYITIKFNFEKIKLIYVLSGKGYTARSNTYTYVLHTVGFMNQLNI